MNSAAICRALKSLLAEEVMCLADDERQRVAVSTPLTYPNGDAVTVWVTAQDDNQLFVSDYGEGWATLLGTVEHERLEAYYEETCLAFGVQWEAGRVEALSTENEVAASVWAVANASVKVAEGGRASVLATATAKPRLVAALGEKVETTRPTLRQAVKESLLDAGIQVGGQVLVGGSGHRHRFSIVVVDPPSIVQPVTGWHEAQIAYAKLGDVRQTIDWPSHSVLDDRPGKRNNLPEQARLLSQVSAVFNWSQFPELIATLRK